MFARTQEELAQMVVTRRECVSTAVNTLRRGGVVDYSANPHLLLDLDGIDRWVGTANQ